MSKGKLFIYLLLKKEEIWTQEKHVVKMIDVYFITSNP